MASKITPQSGLLEVDGRLKVKDAIYANEVLTKGAVGKTLERQVLAAELIDTTSGTIPIVVAVNNASAYDVTTELPKVKVFDDATGDKIIGVVVTTIQNATSGFALNYGPVTSNLNTSASTVNAPVYADPANGELTLTNTGKQVGTVLTLHASAGEILINVAGEAGSSGGGDTNFISDSSPETGLAANFTTYDDGATAVPVNGAGGVPTTLTFAAYTASPVLRTVGDWKLTKSAANGQGEGLAYDFSIEPAFKNQVMECEFNYNASANYASNDMGMYIYDITNSILIYPNVINIPQTNGTNSKMFFKFFATSGVSYRVIFHVQTTNALAYTFSFTDFSVRPETKVIGAAISDWISYTPTVTGFGTPTSAKYLWRRVGDSIILKGAHINGTCTATPPKISLPSGLTIDTDKLASSSTYQNELGVFHQSNTDAASSLYTGTNAATYFRSGAITNASSTEIGLVHFNSSSAGVMYLNDNATIFINDAKPLVFETHAIPVAQWSSNVNLIQSQTEFAYNTDTAVAADDTTSFAYGPSGTAFVSISSGSVVKKRVRFKQPIQITDKIEVEVNNGNGWQSLPYADTSSTIIENFNLYDGAAAEYYGLGYKIVNSTDVDVVFGGSGRAVSNGAFTWAGVTSFKWRVRKSAGSATGEVAPFVGAKYNTSVAATVSSADPFQWSTKDYDTHNAVTTGSSWKFTAPISGYYSIKAVCANSSGAEAITLYKNGSLVNYIGTMPVSNATLGCAEIKLEQGDYIDVRTVNSVTGIGSANYYVAISKIG